MKKLTTEQRQWRTLQNMLRGYRFGQILMTCARLGVFDALASNAQTATELAPQLNVNANGLARLLNAAVSLKLLKLKKNSSSAQTASNRYAIAPLAQTSLLPNSPFPLARMMRREHAFYQRWAWLDEAVKMGTRPDANIRDEKSSNWVMDFELALFDSAKVQAPVVAELLKLPADRTIRVLDVGGGHGGYSMALARQYPNAQPTVFELPEAAKAATHIIASQNMSTRVAVHAGDFQKEDFLPDWDMMLLFGVLVSETPEGKLRLLRKCHAGLAKGGIVVIREWWLDDNRAGPLESTLFSLHMLLSKQAGDISTQAEMSGYLREAGFSHVRVLPLPEWLGGALVMGEK